VEKVAAWIACASKNPPKISPSKKRERIMNFYGFLSVQKMMFNIVFK
jgi:hypothetical protein